MDYTTLSLAEVKTGLAEIARDVESTFGALNGRQLNWRPDAARWSVAQCLEHLLTANRLMIGQADDALDPAHPRSVWQRLPVLPGLLGRLIVRSQAPEATRKYTAPASARPATSDIAADVVQRFVAQHRDAVARVAAMDEGSAGPDDHDLAVRPDRHLQRAGRLAPDAGARPASRRTSPARRTVAGVSEGVTQPMDLRQPQPSG